MDVFHSILLLISSSFFIVALRSLSSPHTARNGNLLGMIGMIIALLSALSFHSTNDIYIIIALLSGALIGIYSAMKINIKSLPEMIAAFNGLGGMAAVLISLAEITEKNNDYLPNSIGLIIGALAFSGSIIAILKLSGKIFSGTIIFKGQHIINLLLFTAIIFLCFLLIFKENIRLFYIMGALSFLLGILLVLPIGGADMPIIISVLNAYSGFAAIGIGFVMNSVIMVIIGTLVGVSGTVLAYIMTKSMNRSLANVILGNIAGNKKNNIISTDKNIHRSSPEDAAFMMENATNIIIVVGYGLAVAQAQIILKKMADILENKYSDNVKFAIHPVAGRMPGHMNVLLAEAGVDYEKIFALDDINNDFASTDIAIVVGANDIVNPAAETDKNSPLYGMPVLEVWKAKTVFVIKRSLSSGYAGVENPLFFYDNTLMIFGDAKEVLEKIVQNLE